MNKRTDIQRIQITFEVIRNYKNCQPKELLTVGVLGAYADFEVGEDYLIYADELSDYNFLTCEKSFRKTDAEAMKKQAYLQQIPYQHSGYMVEYSQTGRKWVEGRLEKGLPTGEWKYYAESGELQAKGSYQNGKKLGEWVYYFHTKDESYRILNEIIRGNYFEMTGTYQMIQFDSNQVGQYKNRISYLVGADTVVEAFYYNQPICSKKVQYKNGLREGKEEKYNEQGVCISSYSFENDRLEGAFFEVQGLRASKNAYLRVEGHYKADKKYNERHLYYENGILSRTKEVFREGKLL